MTTERVVFDSIEQMTQPGALTALTARPIHTAQVGPFEPLGWSATDSKFLAVSTNDGAGPALVIKQMSLEWDWLMNATDDRLGRSVTIWQKGLLDRMPPEIDHTIVGCAKDGNGWAIMMRNVTQALLDDGPISESDNAVVLDAMASLHVAFWEDPGLDDPALGLCSPANLFTHSSPEKSAQFAARRPAFALTMFMDGWRLLPTLIDRAVADDLDSLARDPDPLTTALGPFARTLVHGDLRVANLGIEKGSRPRAIFLDFARPTPTIPAADLAWYLATSALPISNEAAIDVYLRRLSARLDGRFDASTWQSQLDLSLLAGFLQYACIGAWFLSQETDAAAQNRRRFELEWWVASARRGLARLH